jgi:hypothetical protein
LENALRIDKIDRFKIGLGIAIIFRNVVDNAKIQEIRDLFVVKWPVSGFSC